MSHMKVTTVGSSGVGKSCLLERIVRGRYTANQASTIGAAFFSIREDDMVINFWDTAGLDRFRSLAPMYIRGSHIVLICSDVPAVESFTSFIKEVMEIQQRCLIVLVVTKSDSSPVVNPELLEFALENEYALFHVSSKTAIGTDALKRYIIEQYSHLSKPKLAPLPIPVKRSKACIVL